MTPLNVITVSCARDLAVNRLALSAVLQRIRASRYTIVVPGRDVPRFKAALPGEVETIAEETVLGEWSIERIAKTLPPAVAERAGWYLQQLLKIDVIRRLAAASEALIWDGDTIPLRPLTFKDSAGRIGFYVGRHERHEPYFETMRGLLGLGRVIRESFIAQCMYVRAGWVHELLAKIEDRTGRTWIEAILTTIPGKDSSEFSEYETIGTYAMTAFGAEVFINHRPWYRWGMAHFGGVERVSQAGLRRLSRAYDYVALESWDQGRAAWLRSRRQRFIDGARRYAGRGARLDPSRP